MTLLPDCVGQMAFDQLTFGQMMLRQFWQEKFGRKKGRVVGLTKKLLCKFQLNFYAAATFLLLSNFYF